MAPEYLKLMLITQWQTQDVQTYLDFVEQCLQGGVTSVQLREKNCSFPVLYDFAVRLKILCQQYGVPLIINDLLDLAIDLDAEGLHLGQSDTAIEVARHRLGKDKIIGLSLESEEQLLAANASSVNYVAASAVFATTNKTNLRKLWGLSGLSMIASQSTHPVIAIGGITTATVSAVIKAGASGVAVIGALHDCENPAQMAQQLLEGLKP